MWKLENLLLFLLLLPPPQRTSASHVIRSSRRRLHRRQNRRQKLDPISICRTGIFAHALPFPPAGKIALFPRHDSARMDEIKKREGDQHGQRVEAVLICFMIGNVRVETVRVFDQAENDPNLFSPQRAISSAGT